MHILLVSHYGLPHKGGVEVVVDELGQRWTKKGHRVTHVTSNIGQSDNDNETLYHRILVPAINPLEKYAIPYPIFHPIKLHNSIKDLIQDVDVVNIHGLLYMSSVFSSYLAHRVSLPVVVNEFPGFVYYESELVNIVERLAFSALGKFTASRSNALIYHNELVAESLNQYFSPDTVLKNIKVGVDTQKFKPATELKRRELRTRWNLNKPTLLFVGRLVYRKGIQLLSQLQSDKFDVVICGRGDFHFEGSNIRQMGFVADDDLISLYQACDAFILLTDGNDFPLVGLETMSCGLPTILFDIPANREYHNSNTGLFIDREAKNLLLQVENFLMDTDRITSMRSLARQYAVAHYDWNRISEQYLDLFQQILQIHKSK